MMAFLIIVPTVLLLISAVGIAVLQLFRSSVGYAWLWASSAALLVLAAIIFMHWHLPLELSAAGWNPFPGSEVLLAFRLDEVSWPYALSLAALLLAVVWTDAARLESDAGPRNWSLSLLVAGLGLLAVMVGSPLALILVWTAVDLLELVIVFSTSAGRQYGEQIVIQFSVRVSGTLLVMAAVLYGHAIGTPLVLDPIPSELALLILLAVGLRLGVLPLNLPYNSEVYFWRGFGNLLRVTVPAISLVMLARMPADVVPTAWRSLFLFGTALAGLYGAGMWLASSPTSPGRPYWVIATAALAVASVVRGDPQASMAWGVAGLLSGSILFLFTAHRRQIMYIPLFGMVGLAGLPFTPAAPGWNGLIQQPFDGFSLLFMLIVLFLLWGFLRRTFVPHAELYRMERWVHTVYPAGLLLLVLGQWFIALFSWRSELLPAAWWSPLAVTVTALAGGSLAYRLRRWFSFESIRDQWLVVAARRVGSFLAVTLRLSWLYRLLGWLYFGLQAFVQLLTRMIEGDGGVLWALVMLAVLVSLLSSMGGTP
jgi:hypothetical protein